MVSDKELFLDDLKGKNGEICREIAFEELEQLFDLNYCPTDIRELELELEETDKMFDSVSKENEKLEDKIYKLEEEIKLLKLENQGVGDLLDSLVIEHGFSLPINTLTAEKWEN
jgi:vacuolar-type H+-ATPase subunit I/STV1